MGFEVSGMGKTEKTGDKYVADSFLLDALSQGKSVGAGSLGDLTNKTSPEQSGVDTGQSKKVSPAPDEKKVRESLRESIVTREPDGAQFLDGDPDENLSTEWIDRGARQPVTDKNEVTRGAEESNLVRQTSSRKETNQGHPDHREHEEELERLPLPEEKSQPSVGIAADAGWQVSQSVDTQESRQSLTVREVHEVGEGDSAATSGLSQDGAGGQPRTATRREATGGSFGRLPNRSASGIGWLAYTVFMPFGFFVGLAVFFFPVFIDRVSLALQSPADGEAIHTVSKSAQATVAGSQTVATAGNQSEVSLALEMEDGLRMIRDRTHLTALADRAIVDADRPAFSELMDRLEGQQAEGQESLRQAAQAEILRVKLFYSGSNRLGPYRIPVREIFDDPVIQEEADLSTFQLIGLLDDRSPERWAVRARAARLLGSRNNPIINRALLKAMERENHLEVLRELVYSFQENTGYRGDFFDVESLRQWWQEKEQVD